VIGRKYKRRGRVGMLKKTGKRPDQADVDDGEACEDGGGRKDGQAGDSEKEGDEEDAHEEVDRTVGPSVIRNALNALVDL
jgi:hypothetical protein